MNPGLKPAAGGAIMHYNAAGERATKSGGRQYLYDLDGSMVAEITHGVFSRGEVYAGGRRWATYANGTTYFNYADWLGTVRVNTQYGGGWTQTCQSLPFGDGQACTNGTRPSPDFFTGKPRDAESGDDDFGARYYNASGNGNADLGRFLTPDWSAGAAAVPCADFADPQTLNLYAYAQNNPLTLTDPNGHCSWFGCLSQLWKEMGGYDDGTRHEIGNTGIVVKDKPAAGVAAGTTPAEAVFGALDNLIADSGEIGAGAEAGGEGGALLGPVGAAAAALAGAGAGAILLARRRAQDASGAQDKKLTPGEIRKLKGAGINPENVKKDFGGGGRQDLYKDPAGNIYVKPKGSPLRGEPTGININDPTGGQW